MTLTRLTSEETAQRGSGTYMCVEDCDVLQVTEVRPQWFGGERSRRAESTSPTSATVSVEGTGPDRDVQALLWLAAQGLQGAGARRPGSRSEDGARCGTQVTRWTRVGQYARLWWESQGTSGYRRGVLDVGRVR